MHSPLRRLLVSSDILILVSCAHVTVQEEFKKLNFDLNLRGELSGP